MKTFYLIFIFLFFSFSQLSAESIINNKSGGPLFLFLVDKSCQPDPNMLQKLMFSMPTDPEFYLSLSCKKLDKTIILEKDEAYSNNYFENLEPEQLERMVNKLIIDQKIYKKR